MTWDIKDTFDRASFVRHGNADKLPAVALARFDLLGVAVQDARPHLPRPRIDLSHSPAEARIHDDERIDRLGVEPRQPRPHFQIDDDLAGAGAAKAESRQRDLFVDPVAIDPLPTRIFRHLHAVSGIGEENEVARFRFGDERVHLRHDLCAGHVGVENNDGLDAAPLERPGDILGVRLCAAQLR